MVDSVKPGDRVEVCGIYRAAGVRVNSEKRVLKSIFRTYIDVITFVKNDKERYNIDIDCDDNIIGKKVTDDENAEPKKDEFDMQFSVA